MRARSVWGILGTLLRRGGRTQGVGNFLQGGAAGDSTVWIGDVVPLSGNGEEGGRDTHGVPATDHGEASEAVKRRDVGDAGGGKCTRGSGNAVREDLRRETTGKIGSFGGAMSLI